jgi:hypothetical protein
VAVDVKRRRSSVKMVVQANLFPVEDALDRFIARHASLVTCTLCGFERLVLRGTLLPWIRDGGM